MRPWTSEEENKLRDMLDADKSAKEIAVELKRTRQAIYARVQRLYRMRPIGGKP
jgi:predicted DNA-binding protein YlxM (UPF0122 family)